MKYTLKNTITSLDEILTALKEAFNGDVDLSFKCEDGIPQVIIHIDSGDVVIKEGDSFEIRGSCKYVD